MTRRRAVGAVTGLAMITAIACCAAVGAGRSEPQSTGRSGRLPVLEYPGLGYTTAPHYYFTCSQEALDAARMYNPREAVVYLVVRQTPTKAKVRDLAERVGVPVSDDRYATMPEVPPSGDEYSATVGRLTASSLGDLDVTLDDPGNYMASVRSEYPDPHGREAPFNDDAAAIADAFVKRSGLLPDGCRLTTVGVGEAVSENLPDGRIGQKVLGRGVVYRRYLGGIPDGSLDVRVNGRGKVYNVTSRMCNIKPFRTYPILTPEEAVKAMMSGEGSLSGPWSPPGLLGAAVDSITLYYYQGFSGDTVQPLFSISGTVARSTDRWSAVVPAIRPEYLKPPDRGRPGSGGGRPGGGGPGAGARRGSSGPCRALRP